MFDKKIFNRILFVLPVLFTVSIIIAKTNWYNYALLNRLNEIGSLIFGLILLCGIFLIHINIESKIKYLVNSLIILILLVSLFAFIFGTGLCRENIIARVDNNPYRVFIIKKNCGATTAYAYKVLLRKSGTLSREKVIFQSYSHPVPQQVNFLSDDTVQISCRDGIHASKFIVSFDKKTLDTDKNLEFYKGKLYE